MLLDGGRLSSTMRVLCFFLLLWNSVHSLTSDFKRCHLNATDRFEDGIEVCTKAIEWSSEAPVTDLSGVSQENLDSIGKIMWEKVNDLRMVNNSNIRQFRLYIMQGNRVEIRRNRNLEYIRARIGDVSQIRISGNPRLSYASLEGIRYEAMAPDRYIQELGECEYDESVKNVNEFEFCKYVEGDLIMENTVGTHVDSKLRKITGCLRIINTELKDIDFLNRIKSINSTCKGGEKSEISGNKNLWLHSAKRNELKKIVPMEITMHPEAVSLCSSEQALSKDFDCTHVSGDFKILQSAVSLHNLETIRSVQDRIVIEDTDFDSLSFPELKSIGKPDRKDPVLVIGYNPRLTTVQFPKLEKAETSNEVLIVVTGNNVLNNADLYQQFSKIAGEKRLGIECAHKEITKMSELSGCTMVSGDLVLQGTTTVSASTSQIWKIDGCLKVIDTSLKDLSFLNLDQTPSCKTESEISGNKELCLQWPQIKELQVKIGKINYKPDEACDITCSTSEFEEFSGCNSLEGDLTITGSDSNNGQANVMAKVRRITGKLTISGKTDATLAFPELVSVGNPSLTEEAILIEGNEKLKEISIPKLKSVETAGSVAIVIKGYSMPKDQAKVMKEAAGDKELKLECDLSNKEIKDFAELDYCNSIKGDLLLKNTKGVLNTKLESIGGCLRVIDTEIDKDAFLSLVSPLQTETCQSGENTEVKGNKNLCLDWSDMKNVKNSFGKPVELSFEEGCEFPCTVEEFAEVGSYCEQFNGKLDIKDDTDLTILARLKRIRGQLKIDGTSLKDIEFPQLSLIDSPDKNRNALYIFNNNALRKLSMPLLKNLTSPDNDPIFIVQNDGFRMSDEFRTTLENAMSSGSIIYYYCHESAEISDFSRIDGCTIMSSDIYFKGEISGNLPKSRLSEIIGCLDVENTNLGSLDFLQMDETTGDLRLNIEYTEGCEKDNFIRGNKDLCIYPFLEKQLKDVYPQLTISDNKPKEECPVVCTAVNGTIPDHECIIVNGDLRIENNCTFDQVLASVEKIHGSLFVKDCSLSSLNEILPNLKNISSTGIPLIMENVETYSNLTEILQFELKSANEDGLLIKISTNQEIPFMINADLKAHFGSKRVEISKVELIPGGVCIFVDPAVEVKNCKTVEGDLILDEKTVVVSKDLIEITGCLVLLNTNMENYEFLTKIEKFEDKCRWKGRKTDISNNSCIPYDIRRKTTGRIKEIVEKDENKKGCYECSNGILPGQECRVIIGDLEINQATSPEVANQLEGVKEIYGRLIVKNSNLPQVSLTQLTKIEATDSEEPAIEITGNNELVSLQIPALVNATSKGKVVVKIEENKKLKKTAELTMQLGKATGSECGEGKSGVCQFSQVKEAGKEAATAGKEKTTEEEGGVSKTVLIVLGIFGAVFLVVGLAGVAVVLVIIKKKGAKKAKKGKGPGQPPKSTMSKVDSKALPKGEEQTSKTKSMAVEEPSKEPEPEGQKKEAEAPGAPGDPLGETAPAPVPNAS